MHGAAIDDSVPEVREAPKYGKPRSAGVPEVREGAATIDGGTGTCRSSGRCCR
jgi:hypothetical protein